MDDIKHIAVGVCTFNRNVQLEKLLTSLAKLLLPDNVRTTLIIVNNYPDNQNAIQAVLARINFPFSVHLVSESTTGLSCVRNRLLTEANSLCADILAMTDDDCIVPMHWLVTMYREYIANGCFMVCGPVHYIFSLDSNKIQSWVIQDSKMLKPVGNRDQSKAYNASTNNVMFNCKLALEYDLWFNMEFNETGGEDVMFFLTLCEVTKRHGTFIRDGYVYEVISKHRSRILWVLTRYLSHGSAISILYRKSKMLKGIKSFKSSNIYITGVNKILQCFTRVAAVFTGSIVDILGYTIMAFSFLYGVLFNKVYKAYSDRKYQ